MNFTELLSIAQKNKHDAQAQLKTSRAPITEYTTPGRELKRKPDISAIKARVDAHHRKLQAAVKTDNKVPPAKVSSGNTSTKPVSNQQLQSRKFPLAVPSKTQPRIQETNRKVTQPVSTSKPEPSRKPSQSTKPIASTGASVSKSATSGGLHLQNRKDGPSSSTSQIKNPAPHNIVKKPRPLPPPTSYLDLLKLATTVQNDPTAEIVLPKVSSLPSNAPKVFAKNGMGRPAHLVGSQQSSKNAPKTTPLDRKDNNLKIGGRPVSGGSLPVSKSTHGRPVSSSSSDRNKPAADSRRQGAAPHKPSLGQISQGRNVMQTTKGPERSNMNPGVKRPENSLPRSNGVLEPARNRRPVGTAKPGMAQRSNPPAAMNGKSNMQKHNPALKPPTSSSMPAAQTWQNPYTRDPVRFDHFQPYRPPAKRPLPDEFEEDDDYDSDMADFIDDGEPEEDTEVISKHIQDMFGYDREKYKKRDLAPLPETTGLHEQWREEAHSLRVGKQEDIEEEERERREELARKKRLRK